MIDLPVPQHEIVMRPEYEVVIIGSGPAGLTAAIYTARDELRPFVIEGPKPQGQLMGTSVVENWPGDVSVMGPELMERMRKHAQHAGAQFSDATVESIDVNHYPYTLTLDTHIQIKARTIIVATGATPKHLGCPGEDTYWGRGVSTCAVCDGILYKNKDVLIVGGGDTAMEHATTLVKFARHVTIVHIRDKLAASPAMQEKVVNHPRVTIRYNETVTEICGNKDKVTGVVLTHQKSGGTTRLSVDGVFIAIGLLPNSEFLPKEVVRDRRGYIQVGEHTQTTVPGIFAAGDVVDARYRQAVTSAGDGCRAALDAGWWLQHKK